MSVRPRTQDSVPLMHRFRAPSKKHTVEPGKAKLPRITRLRAAIEHLETRDYLSVSLDPNGWTVVTPSADSRQIYVSSSGGSDKNDGLSTATPVASINKAYSLLRNGFPDWILFKRGDTFVGNFGYFNDSGRSTQEPAVITAYGDVSLPRPVIDGTTGTAFHGGAMIQHVDLLDLSFTTSTHNPTSPNFTNQGSYGIYDLGTMNDFLVEDCSFSYFGNNISLQGTSTYGPVTNITIRRNEILDAFNTNGNSQGMYAEQVNGLTIQENVFDHNGWSTLVPGATANIFSHDCYLHSSDTNVVVTGNLFAEASSHGLQARGGGIVDNNLFLSDPTSLSFGLVNGSTTHPGGVSGEVLGNVFLKSRALAPTSPGGIGAQFGNLKPGGGTEVANNIFEDDTQGGSPAIQFQPGNAVANPAQEVGLNTLTVEQNVVYNWGFGLSLSNQYQPGVTGSNNLSAVVIRNNDFQNNLTGRIVSHGDVYDPRFEIWSGNHYSASAAQSGWFTLQGVAMSYAAWLARIEPTAQATTVQYADPTRTLETYMASLGLMASEDSYLAGVRALSKTNWDARYFPSSVVSYIHGGFVSTSGGPQVLLTPPPNVNQDVIQTFTVTYTDPVGIDASSLGDNDIVVSGPNGFLQSAKFSSISGSGTSYVVTYTLSAPGGTWATLTDGTYVVSLADGQVKNIAGTFIPGQSLGSFQMTVNPAGDPNTATSAPGTPSNFSAVASPSPVFLNWTAPGGQSSYLLQRSDNAGFTTNLKTFPLVGSSVGYTDETAIPGKGYFYQLIAVNASGRSQPTAPTPVLPAAPVLTGIIINDGNTQRTPITSASLIFTQPVTVDPTMVSLVQNPATSATPIPVSLSNPSGDGKVWVVSWSTAVANNALPDGAYNLTVHGASITDAFGQAAGGDTVNSFKVDIAPYVTASVFAHSAPPHSLSFTFSKDVSNYLSLGAIKVLNSSSQPVAPATYNWNATTLTATWTFAGALPDGSYTARLTAASVLDGGGVKLDGNGDGIPGDDFVYSFTQVRPSLALTGVANVNINIPFTLNLGAVTDPGQIVQQYIVHWGDGNSTTYATSSLATATYTYPTEVGPTKITVDIVDANGTHLSSGSLSLSVNRATIAVTGNNAFANVGGVYTLALGAVIDKGQTVTGYIVHWGDGATTNLATGATSATHTFTAAAKDTIQVDVIDAAGTNLNAGTLPVNVVTAPSVPLTGTFQTNAGGTYRLVVGAAFDQGYAPTGYTIFWGDGAKTSLAAPGVITHVYASAGPETITATVFDATNPTTGFANAGRLALTVNPPPTVLLSGSPSANQNGVYSLTVNPANDPFQTPTNYLVHWGDGTSVSLLAPGTLNHVFTNSGPNTITVDLTDGTGTFLVAGSLPITVGSGPTVPLTGNPVANAGGTYTLNFGAPNDPSGSVTGYLVHWGDGTTSPVASNAPTATHIYAQPGPQTIAVDLTDTTGTYLGAGTLGITVSQPTVSLSGKAGGVQGINYSLTVNGANDQGGTPSGYLIHWGDGSTTPLASPGALSHAYVTPGNYLITADLTDSTGTFTTAGSLPITVASKPTLSLTGSANAGLGTAYTLNLGPVNDPAGTVNSYVVNWGDGTSTPVTASTPSTGDGPVTHTYNSTGPKTITVDLTDTNGTFTAAGTLKVTVNSTATVAVSAKSPIVAGTPFALTVGPANDPGQVVSGYVVNWGDGSTTPLVAVGTTSHTYATSGPRNITVDLTDGTGTHPAAGTLGVTVNAAPTLALVAKRFANATGTFYLRFGAATDSVGPITGYVINWGDGSAPQTYAPSTALVSHTYTKLGQANISASVTDATGTYLTPNSLSVKVSPPPSVALSGAPTASTVADYTLNFGLVKDPGYAPTGYVIHWGDGSAAQAVGPNTTAMTHRFAKAGPANITVDLTDPTGTYPAASSLAINVTSQPSAPTVVLTGNSFANAGGVYTLNLSQVIDPNGPVTGYIINWGDGSAPQSLAPNSLTTTHTFASPGPATIIASVVDGTGTYANAGNLPITVSPAPTVALSGNPTVTTGSVYSLTLGAVTDPGYSPTGFIIHWGDGSQAQSVAAGTTKVTHTYTASGAQKITVDLLDATGTYPAAGTLSLNVVTSPTIVLTGNSFANAGGIYTLNFGTATDGNGPVTGLVVNWGDGSAPQSFPAATLKGTHTYASPGPTTIAASITDATGTYANAGTRPVTVSPAPTVALSGVATANAGGLYTLNLGAVTDPGYSATGYVIHWGDGSAAQSIATGTTTVTHKFTSPAPAKITADLSDATGTYANAGALNITVNPAPTVALSGPSTATAGSSYTLTIGAPSDPGYVVTGYTIHWGDGSAAQGLAAGSTSATHTFTTAGSATITIDLTDSTGTFAPAGTRSITIVSAATPSVALSGNANANAGGLYTLNLGAVTDPGQTPTGFVIHWGDGSAVQSVAVGTTSVTHKFASPLAAKIIADITDAGGTRAGAGALNVTVNPAPTLALVGSANATATANYTFTLGALTDPGYAATGYTVHFGDGSVAVAYPAGTTTVTHKYASPLAAQITVDVTDATGTYLGAGALNLTVNPTPTIVLSGASTVNTGAPFTLTLGKVTDPGQTVTGYVVHWGDGGTTNLAATATTAAHTYAATGAVTVKVDIIDSAGTWLTAGQLSLNVTTPTSVTPKVVGRYVYYNNSSFDGNSAAATTADFAAVATDKQALLPGQTASFANYTSYSNGINGIMIDMAGLPAGGSLSVADFAFRTGLGGNPTGWALAPAPAGIVIFRGVGAGGSDRVALTWADGAIAGKWLQIKVLATANTKLATADVFYFGNAPGATGTTTTNPMVTSDDSQAVLPEESGDHVTVTNAFDFNRDGVVNSIDFNIAQSSETTAATALQIITT